MTAWNSLEMSRIDTSQAGPLRDPFAAGRRLGRAGLLTVVLLFGTAFTWLALAPLNGAVVVPAQVKVEDSRKTVQHLEGGIVRDILVRDGDRVQAGQALLQLEEVQADSAVQGLQDQLDAEIVRSLRAGAEQRLQAGLAIPPELQKRALQQPKLRSLLAAETELFAARRKQLVGQAALLRNQQAQVRAEAQGLSEQIRSAAVTRQLLAEELAINQDLQQREYVQRTRVMAFERALAEKDEARGAYDAEHAKAQQKLAELELKLVSLQDDYVKRASDELSDANRRALELQERLRPLRQTLARQVVLAPAAGEVVDLRVHTVGAAIGPREQLMDIVPENARLLLEGKVRTEDVAELHLGQAVEVQIAAFRQRSTSPLSGTLVYVSADSLLDNVNGAAMAHYLVQVVVDPAGARALPSPLAPGMPATLFIQTRARTAGAYLLQPITDLLNRAFRER